MKAMIISTLTMALLTSASFAQNTSTQKIPTDDGISSKGFRISYVRPNLSYKIEVSGNGIPSFDFSGKLDETNGLSFGYASLPIQAIGWTSNATLLEIKNEGSSTQIGRLDGNLAYAFNKYVHTKGGLNLSKFVKSDNSDKLSAGVGFQGGLGLQMTKNLGLDVGYTEIRQSGKMTATGSSVSQDFNVDYKESGVEFGLTGTF